MLILRCFCFFVVVSRSHLDEKMPRRINVKVIMAERLMRALQDGTITGVPLPPSVSAALFLVSLSLLLSLSTFDVLRILLHHDVRRSAPLLKRSSLRL